MLLSSSSCGVGVAFIIVIVVVIVVVVVAFVSIGLVRGFRCSYPGLSRLMFLDVFGSDLSDLCFPHRNAAMAASLEFRDCFWRPRLHQPGAFVDLPQNVVLVVIVLAVAFGRLPPRRFLQHVSTWLFRAVSAVTVVEVGSDDSTGRRPNVDSLSFVVGLSARTFSWRSLCTSSYS